MTSSMSLVSNMSSTNTTTLLLVETVVRPSLVTVGRVRASAFWKPRAQSATLWAMTMTRQHVTAVTRLARGRFQARNAAAARMTIQAMLEIVVLR